jgi:hypothetical protein
MNAPSCQPLNALRTRVRTNVWTTGPTREVSQRPRTPPQNALPFATEAPEPGTYPEGKGAARDAVARRVPGPRKNPRTRPPKALEHPFLIGSYINDRRR